MLKHGKQIFCYRNYFVMLLPYSPATWRRLLPVVLAGCNRIPLHHRRRLPPLLFRQAVQTALFMVYWALAMFFIFNALLIVF